MQPEPERSLSELPDGAGPSELALTDRLPLAVVRSIGLSPTRSAEAGEVLLDNLFNLLRDGHVHTAFISHLHLWVALE